MGVEEEEELIKFLDKDTFGEMEVKVHEEGRDMVKGQVSCNCGEGLVRCSSKYLLGLLAGTSHINAGTSTHLTLCNAPALTTAAPCPENIFSKLAVH